MATRFALTRDQPLQIVNFAGDEIQPGDIGYAVTSPDSKGQFLARFKAGSFDINISQVNVLEEGSCLRYWLNVFQYGSVEVTKSQYDGFVDPQGWSSGVGGRITEFGDEPDKVLSRLDSSTS